MIRIQKDQSLPTVARKGPISYALFRMAREHRNFVSSLLRPLGLFVGQDILLMHLMEKEGITQTDLIEQIGLDPSTLTKMLSRLEKTGLVTKKPGSSDRRVMEVYLTESGKSLKPHLEKMWQDLEKRTLGQFTAEEKGILYGMLKKMEGSLKTG